MEPNPHPAQVPPAARSLQVHDKRRLGSTLSSNHILRHRKTCLSFPKTYFELLQTVSLFPKTTFCVNSNHGMKSVVYSPCSSNHILRHRKTCLSFPKTYFELPQTVSLFPKTTFRVNSNHGMKSVVYIVHAPQTIFCVTAKRVFDFLGCVFRVPCPIQDINFITSSPYLNQVFWGKMG